MGVVVRLGSCWKARMPQLFPCGPLWVGKLWVLGRKMLPQRLMGYEWDGADLGAPNVLLVVFLDSRLGRKIGVGGPNLTDLSYVIVQSEFKD